MSNPQPEVIYFQGAFVPAEDARLSVKTHFMHYGTACFEGIRAYWNPEKQALYLFQAMPHFKRLLRSARILHMQIPLDAQAMTDLAVSLLRQNNWHEDTYLRPLVYTSAERIGLGLHGVGADFTMFQTRMGHPLPKAGARVGVSSWRRVDDTMIPARAKITGAYVNSALAKSEAKNHGYDDAILLNADGHVAEGTGMNLFMVKDGQLVTPGVDQNILEGITRQTMITLAKQELGLTVIERPIDRTELYTCDEILLCGTGIEVLPVTSVDDRVVGDDGRLGPVTDRLVTLYDDVVRGRLPAYMDWLTPVPLG